MICDADEREPFWFRQSSPEITFPQTIFDVSFGIVLPLLFLIVDPVVFKGGVAGPPLLARFQLFAYLVSAIEILLFASWLMAGKNLRVISAAMGGAFIAGGLFSLTVGILILPYSIIGLMILIGALGFTPFVTSWVYARNGIRALRAQHDSLFSRLGSAVAAAFLVIALPALVGVYVERVANSSVAMLLNGDSRSAEVAVSRLKWLPIIPEVNRREWALAYEREESPEKRQLLEMYYKEVTGEDIKLRLAIIND